MNTEYTENPTNIPISAKFLRATIHLPCPDKKCWPMSLVQGQDFGFGYWFILELHKGFLHRAFGTATGIAE